MDIPARRLRLSALAAATALAGTLLASAPGATQAAPPPHAPSPSCALGNGIRHVVELTFDNVHFFRDNPNVASDLEQIPALTNFIESNGTMLSNNHTPLIAHTADDILTNFTGLYGDRHGDGISNGYQYYNNNVTTTGATAFTYWTDHIINSGTPPKASATDPNPNMVYSAHVPAQAVPSAATGVDASTPAPWVPFTRAGCNFGAVSTANQELENVGDIPQVFGASSPENAQLMGDKDTFKDTETADYIGVAIHCGAGPAATVCSSAEADRGTQTTPSPSAAPDLLPDEPGGYRGFLGLFGHRYVAPALGAGTPSVTHNGYPVTNAQGNLVDLAGSQINGSFLNNHPGFPGFGGISASQTLAYMADMQESGVAVTSGYISDIHGNNHNAPACASDPASALGPGDPCYEAQAAAYNQAFTTFFTRLAADGITPANTLFVFTADEGDHLAGADAGRSIAPTCSGTPGTTSYACTYAKGQIGELSGNLTGLLATEEADTTPFSLEADSAPEIYITGNPSPTSTTTRTLERDVAGLQANNPYAGQVNVTGTGQPIANYLADPTEEALLHFVNADPARTPSFALFAKPDYFLSTGKATCSPPSPTSANSPTGNNCVVINPGFAWNHGDYAPEVNSTWLGLVGPGVAHKGLDGWDPTQGPSSAGPDSGQGTVPQEANPGTWADHTDIRPTVLALAGLKDDYTSDGRVLVEDLTPAAYPTGLRDPASVPLMECYKQMNSSVGAFGTDTLQADTAALRTGSTTDDSTYTSFLTQLAALGSQRDALATTIKDELGSATDGYAPINPVLASQQTRSCQAILAAAAGLSG